MYDLVTNIIESINEQTTMTNVSYLPGGFAKVNNVIKALSHTKSKWQLEVIEDDIEKILNFEGQAKIGVPVKHWNSFIKEFGYEPKTGIVNLNNVMLETAEGTIEKRLVELKSSLTKLFNSEPFKSVDRQIVKWNSTFRKSKLGQLDSLVSFTNKRKDILDLSDKLGRIYKDDLGYLELLIEAIKEKMPLNSFEVFKSKDNLYSCKIVSTYDKIRLVFDTLVNMSFEVSQTITIKNKDVLAELKDLKSIKVVSNTVYPVGKKFEKNVFKYIQDVIDELEEE